MGDVIEANIKTKLPIPVDKILEGAKGKLTDAIVIGWDESEDLYVATSMPLKKDILYLLEIVKYDMFDKY